jgi:hypothetical protein
MTSPHGGTGGEGTQRGAAPLGRRRIVSSGFVERAAQWARVSRDAGRWIGAALVLAEEPAGQNGMWSSSRSGAGGRRSLAAAPLLGA